MLIFFKNTCKQRAAAAIARVGDNIMWTRG